MSIDTKEIVDDFASGFAGHDVLKTVSSDFVDNEPDVLIDDPRVDDPTSKLVATPTVPVVIPEQKKIVSVPEDEYKRIMSSLDSLTAQQSETERKFSQAFGKIGSVEDYVRKMQEVTPAGEPVVLSDEDVAGLAENFPSLTVEMRAVIDKALSKVHGVNHKVVEMVDDTRIANSVEPLLQQERIRAKQEFQRELVLDVHPDLDEIRVAPEFRAWANKQPEDWKKKHLSTWSPRLVISTIDGYKQSLKPTISKPDARAEALTSAINPRSSGSASPAKTLSDDDQFNEGFKTG